MRITLSLLCLSLMSACAGDHAADAGLPYAPPQPAVGKADFSSGVTDKGALEVGGAVQGALTLDFEFHAYSLRVPEARTIRLSGAGAGFDAALFLYGPRAEGAPWALAAMSPAGVIEGPLAVGDYVVILGPADGVSKGDYQVEAACLDCPAPEPEPEMPPEAGACVDLEIGEAIGEAVASGSTLDGEDRVRSTCAGGDAPEALIRWQAPEAGRYRFSTFGSDFGTVLYLMDGCGGEILTCNNNAQPGTYQSRLDYAFEAGEAIIIGVDGYAGHQGEFQLNIEALDRPLPAEGVDSEALKADLRRDLARAHRHIGYDRARDLVFQQVDKANGEVECVYTGERLQVRGTPSADVMNIEHTWPKSRGASGSPARGDLHHLFPTMSESNSRRSSYPFGEVSRVWWSNDRGADRDEVSLLGTDGDGDVVFEPRAAHQGNVARALFYFSVRYDLPIDAEEEDALRRWHEADPVDGAELDRNDRVERYQGNRNPFIDQPGLVDLIDDF